MRDAFCVDVLRLRARPGKPAGGWKGAREAARRVATTITPVMIRAWHRYHARETLTEAQHEELYNFKVATVGYLCSMHQLATAIVHACPTCSELDLAAENEALRDRIAELERLLTLQAVAE